MDVQADFVRGETTRRGKASYELKTFVDAHILAMMMLEDSFSR